MRRLVFATIVLVCGCAKAKVESATPLPPVADPVVARREDDAQAAYSLDAACASIEQALDATKKLAPVAGGDAKEALLDVADMLDTAGSTLADHNDPPPPIEQYRKADPTEDRRKAVTDSLEALKELRDTRSTLEDLSDNVPTEHKKPLEAIQSETDEAIDAVQGAIGRLGGKVPPEEDDAQSNERS